MLKKKLFLVAATLLFAALGGGGRISAYTVDGLVSAGWTKITSISQSDITDKFYVFLSNDEDLMLGLAPSANQSSTSAFYQTLANPASDAKKVWMLEINGENYAMRNLYSNSRQMQTEYSGEGNDLRWRTNDQTASISWTGLGLTYEEGAWTLTSTQYSRPLGIYNNEMGTPIEGVELGANDAGKGQKFQIYAINREDYWTLAAKLATKTIPVTSMTGAISNQEIYNNNKVNLPSGWSEEKSVRATGNDNRTAGTGITVLEAWRGSSPLKAHYYQTISGLPNGVYTLTAKAQDQSGNGGGNIYLSDGINEQKVTFGTEAADVTTPQFVLDGNTLTIGIRADGGASWVNATDFRLNYYGKYLRHVATDLPLDGNITADTWYKYIVAVDGNYTIQATNAANIVQSTDGDQYVEDITSTSLVTGDNVNLTAGDVLFFKSTTNNVLTIDANIKTYTLGTVTAQSIANGSYLNGLTTLVLTYGDAATNDGEASLAVIGSVTATLKKGSTIVTTGALTADNTERTLTATFEGVVLEANSDDYSIVIPAGAFGYAGKSVNTETAITFKTGVFADGLYYLQKAGTSKYLGRGGAWGTQAVVTDLGISFELAVQSDGKYLLKNHDHSLAANAGLYLGLIGESCFTDATSAQFFAFKATTGGYYLCPDNTSYFTTGTSSADIDVPYDYISLTATEGDAIVWVPVSKNDYLDNIAALRNAEASAVATSAGKTAASVAELTSLLASEFWSTDMTSKISNPACIVDLENWTQVKYAREDRQKNFNANGVSGEVWDGLGGIKQEITGLSEGIYKVSIHATWRPGTKDSGIKAGNEINTNAWVYANTATSNNLTQLKSWYSGGATIDSRADMIASEDTYLNDVYVYVKDGETLTIGLASPTWCNGAWLPFFDWSLTYYEAKASANMTITDAQYATFIAPFDVAIPSGVTASTVTAGEGKKLTLTPVATTIPANTPVVLYSEAPVNQNFFGMNTATEDTYTEGILTGNLGAEMDAPVGSYVLQKQTDGVAFYSVESGSQPKVGTNRAYVNAGAFGGAGIKALFFDDDEASAIESLDVLTSGEYDAIYNAAGIQVDALQKGLNIVVKDGKSYKIYVK